MNIALHNDKLLAVKKTPLLRLGHLMAFTGFLNEIGAPFETYLERNSLPVACDDPDCYVPVARVWSFFADITKAEDPMLAWIVGRDAGDRPLNAGLLRTIEFSSSLYQAIQAFLLKTREEATGAEIGILERKESILLYTRYPGRSGEPGYHQSQAYQIGVLVGLIRHFLGEFWTPSEIGLEARNLQPGLEDLFPGCRIRAGQSAGYIAIPRNCLHVSACDLHRHADALKHKPPSAPHEVPDDANMGELLQELLKSYLPDGYPSAAKMAELLGFSERTFARKLSMQGLSYGAVVDQARFAMAKELLRQPGMKVGDVALSIGFDDQSNFGRMFRRLAGLSPKQYSASFLH